MYQYRVKLLKASSIVKIPILTIPNKYSKISNSIWLNKGVLSINLF